MPTTLSKILISAILCSWGIFGIAQIPIHSAPGGVKGAIHWFSADTFARERLFKSQLSKNSSIFLKNSPPLGWLNRRPALVLNGRNLLSIDLGKHDLSKATYFTVYQTQDLSQEHLIWNIEKNKQPSLVLTTARMADLQDYRYMNFTDVAPATPKINIYGQLKQADSLPILEQKWNLGKVPLAPQLPVADFIGLLPELIVFDRVLDRAERLKVASYLALKYAITLTETSGTYVNSQGQVLWNGEAYPAYHHNIAGIGRDDSSGLLQKIASSSNYPNLLSISVPNGFANGDFLIWGDNDLTLAPAPKIIGMPALLQRQWLLTMQGKTASFTSEILLDTKQIHGTNAEKPVYWMLIDRSGQGGFKLPDVQFIKMQEIDSQGFVRFKASWPGGHSEKNIFSFVAAQDLLLAATVSQPSCALPESGQIQVKVVGGQAPYLLTVENKTTGTSSHYRIRAAASDMTLPGLAAGKYFLKVSDAQQQVYVDSFFINPADAPRPLALAAEYELTSGKTLQLNAADQLPPGIFYYWRSPDHTESTRPILEIKQAGTYTLTTSKAGCSYTQEIQVKAPPVSIFSAEVVYPNPSAGMFNVKVVLSKPATLILSVYSAEGKQVLSKKSSGSDHYTFSEQLRANGLYYLVLQAGSAISTHKLLVIH
jgi:hypothetical protein